MDSTKWRFGAKNLENRPGLPILPEFPFLTKTGENLDECGDDGARTRYLRVANAALSQMSYVPKFIWDFGFGISDLTTESADPPSNFHVRNPKSQFPNTFSGRTWIRTKDLSLIRAAL